MIANKIDVVLFFIFISLSASCAYATSYAPCSNEQIELKASTPNRPVVGMSLVSSLIASVGLAFEHGPPASRDDSLKRGLALGVLSFNYIGGFFSGTGACSNNQGSFNAAPLSVKERAETRRAWINRTYFMAGANAALSTAMFIVAEHPTNRALAAGAVIVPLVAAWLDREQFRLGPALDHKTKYTPELGGAILPTPAGYGFAPGFVAQVRF